MWGWISRLFGRADGPPGEAARIEQARLGLERRLLEANVAFYDNLVDPREPLYDVADFIPQSGPDGIPLNYDSRKRGEAIPVYLTELGLKQFRDQSRRLLATNEFALNAVTNRISYTVGKGFQVTAVSTVDDAATRIDDTGLPSGDLAERVQEVIDDFAARTAWGERQQECVMRCDRDGETFLRLFHVGGGRCTVRFVEPELVKDYTGQFHRSFGVITDPEDVETVLGYSIVENPQLANVTTDVPAEEVVHVKLNTDSSAKRGLPTLYPVRKNLERAEKLLRNMSILAQVQATFALIRKHRQTGKSAIDTFQRSTADASPQNPFNGRTQYMQQMPPGSIIDATENTDFEFPASTVNASALTGILQAELRAVAARLVMPEYMLTVDASNANYSSSLVAEAPAVKNFELLQEFYARRFGDGGYTAGRLCGLLWRVIAIAVREGLLPPEALTDIELQVEGPQIVSRDKDQETRRAESLNKAGILSKRTWAKWEGLDRDQEQAQIEQDGEQQQGGAGDDPFGGMFGGDGGSEGDDPFGGDSPTGRAASAIESFLEAGYSGRKRDARGRTRCYSDGKIVPCGSGGPDKAHGSAHANMKRLVANPAGATPHDVARAANAISRLTTDEAKKLAREYGIVAGGSKGSLAKKIASAAAKQIGERERFKREAVKAGIDPNELFATSKQFGEATREHLDTVRKMIGQARKEYASEHGKQLTRNHKAFRGGDYTDIAGFERLARSLADRYPELLGAHGYERGDGDSSAAAAALYDYLYAGTPKAPRRSELHQQALEYLSNRKPAEPTGRAAGATLPKAISDSLAKAPRAKRKAFTQAATEAVSIMPQGAQDRMNAALKGIDFHADAREIGPAMIREAMQAADANQREYLQGVIDSFEAGEMVAGGCYSPATGRARLDGDATMPAGDDGKYGHSGKVSAAGIYAHEFAHAIDQGEGGEPLSRSPKWSDAFEQEIQHHDAVAGRPKEGPPPLSRYATTQPAEGFAEFARLVYASDVPHSRIRDEFPLASEFFQSQGLWPEEEREGGEGTFAEAFDERVQTDGEGGHIDTLLYDDEVPF